MSHQKGVLLVNLGTPDDCTPKAVRTYLKEFLMDRRVIDIPALWRWLLVNLIIVPFRHRKSAAAYQTVWTNDGSPLLVFSEALKAGLAAKLGDAYQVELGMRYGQPNIKQAFQKMKSCSSITVIPLFPQYASAANGSAIEKFLQIAKSEWNLPNLAILSSFHNHPGFIQAYTAVIKKTLQDKKIDQLVFSYHGLPERHINKSHCDAPCDKQQSCPAIKSDNAFCYRAQCYATSHLIADNLNLTNKDFTVAFQSRLGRTPWIKPYTDLILPKLREKGIKNIAVVCPSFVADCLETLEEMDIRGREQWQELGGDKFYFIPCLNDNEIWIDALVDMVHSNA